LSLNLVAAEFPIEDFTFTLRRSLHATRRLAILFCCATLSVGERSDSPTIRQFFKHDPQNQIPSVKVLCPGHFQR
jgi:hypothetical protein